MHLTPERPARLRAAVFAVAVLTAVLAACSVGGTSDSPDGSGDALVTYVRVWEDGFTEEQSVAPDGRVLMKHGDTLERFTLPSEDVEAIRVALEGDIPTGTADDRPQRTLILADGTVIEAPRPEPGTITELMDQLMDRHSLE